MTLLSDVNSLGFQEDLVSNWEPAHSLVEDFISGAEIAPYLSALAVACLPLCLRCGNGLVRSQLAPLWYSLNPLFCEQTQLCLRLKLFAGSLSFFFSFLFFCLSMAILQNGLLSHISSLRAFSPGPYPKHATLASLFSPCSLEVDTVSGLLLCWKL